MTRARQLLPLAWHTRAEPAFFPQEGCLRVATAVTPDPHQAAALSVQLERETGIRLVLNPARA